MAANSHTIFSIKSTPTPQENESGKVSYWLKKLFYQQEERNEQDKKQKIEQIRSELNTSSSSRNNTNKDNTIFSNKFSKFEAQKNTTLNDTNVNNMERMVESSNRINISATSVFPWDLFGTTINVEDTRVTIIFRQLFSSQVHTVELKDISNVLLESGILFATIRIISRTFAENEIRIGRLWKKDAQLVHRAIEGFRKFERENIDISHFSTEELISKLNEMSTA